MQVPVAAHAQKDPPIDQSVRAGNAFLEVQPRALRKTMASCWRLHAHDLLVRMAVRTACCSLGWLSGGGEPRSAVEVNRKE